jgi:hypothetical protein
MPALQAGMRLVRGDSMGTMRMCSRWLRPIVACAVLAIAVAAGTWALATIALSDVRSHVGPNGRVELATLRPSLQHGIVVSVHFIGAPELSSAHWYLFPWRQVIIEM